MRSNIRAITDYGELQRCVDFQRLIWGEAFAEVVPAAILWVAIRTGGIVAGAFDDEGAMIGFVFGITGFVEGRPYHWSDMLAVHPAARGAGLGRELKVYQRDTLLDAGVHRVGWTFDPLEARNAHLNFSRLGITVREYVPDCYGVSSSPLHAGLATDRLVADWTIATDRVAGRLAGSTPAPGVEALQGLPVLNDGGAVLQPAADRVAIRIPADIQALKRRDPAAAVRWRTDVREAFLASFDAGYHAVELVPETPQTRCYLLERRDRAGRRDSGAPAAGRAAPL